MPRSRSTANAGTTCPTSCYRDEVIDEAVRGAERHFAGERDATLPVESGFADWKPGDPDAIKNSEFVTLQNAQIRALALQPIVGAIAARLTGSDTSPTMGRSSWSRSRRPRRQAREASSAGTPIERIG